MAFVVRDHFYKLAKSKNLLARSVFKLEEIQKKYNLFKPGQNILDLGHYPGSWSQYLAGIVGNQGCVTGVDLQGPQPKLNAYKNIKQWNRDVFSIKAPLDLEVNRPFDIIVSDMAPKTTGVKIVDQQNSLALVEKVYHLLPLLLVENGHTVIKLFEGQDSNSLLKEMKTRFRKIYFLRPKATRSQSKEIFIIGKGFKKNP